jgi:hypothetical protein
MDIFIRNTNKFPDSIKLTYNFTIFLLTPNFALVAYCRQRNSVRGRLQT